MAEVLLVNPRSRKKRKSRKKSARKSRSTARARSAARRGRVRRFRRNPSSRKFNLQNFAKQTLMPSAVGAVGALGVDMIMGLLPLPANFKTGPLRPVVKGVGAVAIGMIASMVTNRKMAEQITAGGLTVVLYDTAKTFLQTQFPQLPLGMYDGYPSISYLNPAAPIENDRYINDSMAAYLPSSSSDMVEYDETIGAYVQDGFNY